MEPNEVGSLKINGLHKQIKLCKILTGPDIVPDASRSPGLMLQPVMVWWVNCCFMVQYIYLKLDCETMLEVEDPAGLIATSR